MREIELFFVPHCYQDGCDLGYVEFKCPYCEELCEDYEELWWHFNQGNEKEAKCTCENCKKEMIIEKLPDEDGVYWSTYYLRR